MAFAVSLQFQTQMSNPNSKIWSMFLKMQKLWLNCSFVMFGQFLHANAWGVCMCMLTFIGSACTFSHVQAHQIADFQWQVNWRNDGFSLVHLTMDVSVKKSPSGWWCQGQQWQSPWQLVCHIIGCGCSFAVLFDLQVLINPVVFGVHVVTSSVRKWWWPPHKCIVASWQTLSGRWFDHCCNCCNCCMHRLSACLPGCDMQNVKIMTQLHALLLEFLCRWNIAHSTNRQVNQPRILDLDAHIDPLFRNLFFIQLSGREKEKE